MFVKYKQARPSKIITHRNKAFEFLRNEWTFVSDPVLFKRLKGFPELFEFVDFNEKDLIRLGDSVKFESKNGSVLIKCNERRTYTILDKLPFITLQAERQDCRIYRVTNCMHPHYLNFRESYDESLNYCNYDIGVFRDLGGWGDVQMALSVVAHLKKKFNGAKITFSCPNEFLTLGENNPNIDKLMPLHEFYKTDFDLIFNLSTICVQTEIKSGVEVTKNRIEIFAEACKLENYLPGKIYLTDEENKWAEEYLNYANGKKILGLIIQSNTMTRCWDKFEELSLKLQEKYGSEYEILVLDKGFNIFGKTLNWEGAGKCVINLPIRKVLSLLNRCSLVIGPDTGPMHSAATLEIPTLWIFSHIDGNIRTKGYNNTYIIQKDKNTCEKIPCWYKVPCKALMTYPKCMLEVSVKEVADKVEEILNKKKSTDN